MDIKTLVDHISATDQPPLLIIIAKTPLRYYYDGNLPTAKLGHILEPEEAVAFFTEESVNQLRFAVSD